MRAASGRAAPYCLLLCCCDPAVVGGNHDGLGRDCEEHYQKVPRCKFAGNEESGGNDQKHADDLQHVGTLGHGLAGQSVRDALTGVCPEHEYCRSEEEAYPREDQCQAENNYASSSTAKCASVNGSAAAYGETR